MFINDVHAPRSKFEHVLCWESPPSNGSSAEGHARLLEIRKRRAKPSDGMVSIDVYTFQARKLVHKF